MEKDSATWRLSLWRNCEILLPTFQPVERVRGDPCSTTGECRGGKEIEGAALVNTQQSQNWLKRIEARELSRTETIRAEHNWNRTEVNWARGIEGGRASEIPAKNCPQLNWLQFFVFRQESTKFTVGSTTHRTETKQKPQQPEKQNTKYQKKHKKKYPKTKTTTMKKQHRSLRDSFCACLYVCVCV